MKEAKQSRVTSFSSSKLVGHPNMTGSEEESGKAPAARTTEGDDSEKDESGDGEPVVSRQDQRKAFEEERKVLLDK